MLEVRSLGIFLAFSVGATAAHGGVIVVDAGGSGQFTGIQEAVTAASEGDTILVKGGNYATFGVDGKAVTIVADTGALVNIFGSIRVVNLLPTQTVVIAGLRSEGQNTYWGTTEIAEAGFYALNNAGPIRVQSCNFRGGYGYYDAYCGCIVGEVCYGGKGVILRDNTAGIAFARSSLYGGSSWGEWLCGCGQPANNFGGDDIELRNGMVALYDCTAYGGNGGDSCGVSGDGGIGAHLTSTGAFTGLIASGTLIRGGGGGGRPNGMVGPGGDGGDGVVLDTGTMAWFVGDTPQGGPGGTYGGTPGQPISGSGQAFDFGVPRLRLDIPTPIRESTTTTMLVRGRSGDEVYLFASRETGFESTAMWRGTRIPKRVRTSTGGLPSAETIRLLGPIPPSGVLIVGLEVPALEPGVLEENWFFQVWRNSAIDGRTLGGFAVVTILDSSY